MSRLVNSILNVAIVIVILLTVFVAGPEVETRLFPVYSKFELIEVRAEDGGTRITVRFSKYRQCIPSGYAWYVGDMGTNFRQVNIVSRLSESPPKPVGRSISTFHADITPIELTDLYAEIYSRCHPFWLTRSAVFP